MTLKRPFEWTTQRQEAVMLINEDRLTDEQIAEKVGVVRTTIARWKRHPEFQARLAQSEEAVRKALIARGVADRQNRIDAYNERWHLMREVIRERATDIAYQRAPGGKTGLLVRTFKVLPTGDALDEFAVDTGLLRELRATEEQAAKELGQWTDKKEVTGKDGGPIQVSGEVFDHDSYSALFGQHLAGTKPRLADEDGANEPLDPADADAETGTLLDGPAA